MQVNLLLGCHKHFCLQTLCCLWAVFLISLLDGPHQSLDVMGEYIYDFAHNYELHSAQLKSIMVGSSIDYWVHIPAKVAQRFQWARQVMTPVRPKQLPKLN